MVKLALVLLIAVTMASATNLDEDNYEAKTAGKYVFLMMHVSWCGHCKRLKPTWESLAKVFEKSVTQLVGEVDCTSRGGKPLCIREGVKGYPTLKWGDPADLQPYTGGRSLRELTEFARTHLVPTCSISNLDLCGEAARADFAEYQAMPAEELKAAYIESLPEISLENLDECAGSDSDRCEKAIKAEVEKFRSMPAEELKLSFVKSLLKVRDADVEYPSPTPVAGDRNEL